MSLRRWQRTGEPLAALSGILDFSFNPSPATNTVTAVSLFHFVFFSFCFFTAKSHVFSASMTSPDNFFSPSEMKDAASPARYSLGVHVPDGAPHKSRDWSGKHLMCELKTNSLHKSRDPFNRGRQPSLRFPLLIPLLVAFTKKKKEKKKADPLFALHVSFLVGGAEQTVICKLQLW